MELVCPAGNFQSLKAAVDNGADAVYIGFKDETNARHFSGLNFNDYKIEDAVNYAREHNVRIMIAINTYAQPTNWSRWQSAIDKAAELKVDAVIAADIAVLDYAAQNHPALSLHLSVQGSATNYEALQFYKTHFNIKRAVLPRVLSLAQVRSLSENSPVDLEVFGFGSLCIMAEGRCHLSSYVTGESPNMCGVCSPANAVTWKERNGILESRLNNIVIDRYQQDEHAGYPTLCKGRFEVEGKLYHALEEPTSLNTLNILPELHTMGIRAVKIEGRQRSPAYVVQVTRVWRQAIDSYLASPTNYSVQNNWKESLSNLSEGSQTTLGAYSRPWQ
jgi:putative protease